MEGEGRGRDQGDLEARKQASSGGRWQRLGCRDTGSGLQVSPATLLVKERIFTQHKKKLILDVLALC